MQSEDASGHWVGGVRNMAGRKGGDIMPATETSMSQRKGTWLGQGQEASPGGTGAVSPLVSLQGQIWELNGCTRQPALSVTSSALNYPGLQKKDHPPYVVGNPHTRDKILRVAYCSAPRYF